MAKEGNFYNPKGIIKSFEYRELKKRSVAQKIADWLTTFFGSMSFLILNLAVFAFWILANSGKVPGIKIFDPFPYFLLTAGVSLEAITLTVIVLISQNRSSQISSMREEFDMHVNLIAEREITKALKILKLILDKNGIKYSDEELLEMIKETDTSYIERKLERELSPKQPSILENVEKTFLKK
ncbi:MAG: DUF1003 domain-containing protein [Patescibacteria group bacterium]